MTSLIIPPRLPGRHRLDRPRIRLTGTMPAAFTARWAETDRADRRRDAGCALAVAAVALAAHVAAIATGAGWL